MDRPPTPWKPAALALVVVLLAGAIACLVLAREPGGPVHQGRTLRTWVDGELDARRDGWSGVYVRPPVTSEARRAIEAIGSDAVPSIRSWLRVETKLERRAKSWLRRLGIGAPPPPWPPYSRAIEVCRILGPVASDALPSLARAAEEVTPNVIPIMAAMGPEAAPHIIGLLRSTGPEVRSRAARSLAGFSAEAEAIIPLLTELLDDPDRRVQSAALHSLVTLQHDDLAPLVPRLVEQLGFSDTMTQLEALKLVPAFGDLAQPARPAIALLQEDECEPVNRAAREAIITLQKQPRLAGIVCLGEFKRAILQTPQPEILREGGSSPNFDLLTIRPSGVELRFTNSGPTMLTSGAPEPGRTSRLYLDEVPISSVLELYSELTGRVILAPSTIPLTYWTLDAAAESPAAAALILERMLQSRGLNTLVDGECFFQVAPAKIRLTAGPPGLIQDEDGGAVTFTMAGLDSVMPIYAFTLGQEAIYQPQPHVDLKITLKGRLTLREMQYAIDTLLGFSGLRAEFVGKDHITVRPSGAPGGGPLY